MVNRNEQARGKPLRVNMIDCGLVVEMGEQDHVNLVKVLGAFIKKDGHLAGQLMIDASKKCNANALDVELFCSGLERIIKEDEQQVSIISFQFKTHRTLMYIRKIQYVSRYVSQNLRIVWIPCIFNTELFGERG